jgi:hypothetical protein
VSSNEGLNNNNKQREEEKMENAVNFYMLDIAAFSVQWCKGDAMDINVVWHDYQMSAVKRAAKFGILISLLFPGTDFPFITPAGSDKFSVIVDEGPEIVLQPVMLLDWDKDS